MLEKMYWGYKFRRWGRSRENKGFYRVSRYLILKRIHTIFGIEVLNEKKMYDGSQNADFCYMGSFKVHPPFLHTFRWNNP